MTQKDIIHLRQAKYQDKPEQAVRDEEWETLLAEGELEPHYDLDKLRVTEVIVAGSNRFLRTDFHIASRAEQKQSHTVDYIASYRMLQEADIFEHEEAPQFKGLSRQIADYCAALKYLGYPESYTPRIHDQFDYEI